MEPGFGVVPMDEIVMNILVVEIEGLDACTPEPSLNLLWLFPTNIAVYTDKKEPKKPS